MFVKYLNAVARAGPIMVAAGVVPVHRDTAADKLLVLLCVAVLIVAKLKCQVSLENNILLLENNVPHHSSFLSCGHRSGSHRQVRQGSFLDLIFVPRKYTCPSKEQVPSDSCQSPLHLKPPGQQSSTEWYV